MPHRQKKQTQQTKKQVLPQHVYDTLGKAYAEFIQKQRKQTRNITTQNAVLNRIVNDTIEEHRKGISCIGANITLLTNRDRLLVTYNWIPRTNTSVLVTDKTKPNIEMICLESQKVHDVSPCSDGKFPNLISCIDDKTRTNIEKEDTHDRLNNIQEEYSRRKNKEVYLKMLDAMNKANKNINQGHETDTSKRFIASWDVTEDKITEVKDMGCVTKNYRITNTNENITVHTQTLVVCIFKSNKKQQKINIKQTSIAYDTDKPPFEWGETTTLLPETKYKQLLAQSTIFTNLSETTLPHFTITTTIKESADKGSHNGIATIFGVKPNSDKPLHTDTVQFLFHTTTPDTPSEYNLLQRKSTKMAIAALCKYMNITRQPVINNWIQPLSQHSIYTPGLCIHVCANGDIQKTSSSEIHDVDQVFVISTWSNEATSYNPNIYPYSTSTFRGRRSPTPAYARTPSNSPPPPYARIPSNSPPPESQSNSTTNGDRQMDTESQGDNTTKNEEPMDTQSQLKPLNDYEMMHIMRLAQIPSSFDHD